MAPPSDLGPLELPPGLTKGGGKPGKKTTSVEDVGGGDSKEDKMADLGSGATDQSKTTIEKVRRMILGQSYKLRIQL